MRYDKLWVVARKDLAEFRTNKYVMYSILLMPLLLAVILPVIYLAPFTMSASNGEPLDVANSTNMTVIAGETVVNGTYSNTIFQRCELTDVIATNCRFEASNLSNCLVRDSFVGNSTLNGSAMFHSNYLNMNSINSTYTGSVDVSGTSEDEAFLLQFINFLLIFFIMIPVIIPTVMASYSFVGEKLNKSLEPLLATPTTDAELLLGKAASIFIPCMLATWLSFIPFVVIVDFLTSSVLGYSPLPDAVWIIGVFVLAPLFCITSIALNVVVSSRVSDVRASQQIGSLVVLPVVVFFVIALAGFFSLGPEIMLLLCGLVLLVDIGITYLSLKTFQRENILVRWK
ncbi:MAG: ABC transporter permease subunit [Methanomassiliicoccus sp.]|nr:ABC transporter permease subunit [Methanomassiliicoccus sp.]